MELATIVGLFNIMVGLMLVVSALLMCGGFILWYVRLGTFPSYRDDAINIMQWGVAILFVLVVLLGVAQFVQTHTALVMMLIGALIAAGVVYVIATSVTASNGEHKEEH